MLACICCGFGELLVLLLATSGVAGLTKIINRIRYARHCRCQCHSREKTNAIAQTTA